MAESRIHRLSLVALLLTVAVGVVFAGLASGGLWPIALGAGAIALAQLITVPAPSGERLFFGLAIAVAVPLLAGDLPTTIGTYAFGMSASWVVLAWHDRARVIHGSRFVAEVVALVAYAVAFHGTAAAFELQLIEGDAPRLIAVAAGGLAWFVTRGLTRAVIGLEREDISVRYLWLLALDDWSVIVSIVTAGALFGFSWPPMRGWAVLVAALPYAFSHLAFVRYAGTRRTYRQTIRALAQIPEVAGLASAGHADRTAALALAMAQELGMHPSEVVDLEYAALMHDIGRITLNEPAILRAGYTDEDIARWGSQIIAEAPHLAVVAEFVRHQHEPYRVPGQERNPDLALASKVIKLASAYDEAVHDKELRPLDALEMIHRGSAYDFDPEVTSSLRRVLMQRQHL